MVHDNSKVENIFFLDEMIRQPVRLGVLTINLSNLPHMTCLFVGPKNSFILQNLETITIVQCEKLETIFSASVLRCLPKLLSLQIQECKELKKIIEDDDVEDIHQEMYSKSLSPKTCFPNLVVLGVDNCIKLKCVFPVSFCKELPELKILHIERAPELEEIFGGEGDQKVEIPKLNFVVFIDLPSLCQQRIQFQTIKHLVRNCPKLSLSPTLLTGLDLKVVLIESTSKTGTQYTL